MATSVPKHDLIFTPGAAGGWYAAARNNLDRSAVRYFYVDGLTSNTNAERMKTAADYVKANYAAYPDDSTLRLSSARAQPLGHPEKALVTAEYRAPRITRNNKTAATSMAVAAVKSDYRNYFWWGDPNTGGLIDASKVEQRMPMRIRIPVWNIMVYAETANSPLTTVGGMVGTLNNASFSLGGHSFAAYELLFEAIDQNPIWDGVNLSFEIMYHFIYRGNNPTGSDGWYVTYEDTWTTPGTAALGSRLEYPSSAWATPPTS